ncbi:AAA family ATPase [Ralstonia insidiosa]|uniref:AAA family ATPase n=1 Tax=Ralstonia insidiosa TaxID=190721 RepID=A0A848NX87_9RALS|nr:AAA family ATPase [Ralstonia insidiosa]NMV37880.1 AAA family ATPase [Ralstonia insidiosa]
MVLRRRTSRYSRMPIDMPSIVRLWMLRLLVPLGGHRGFILSTGFSNDAVAEALGLDEWIYPESEEFNPQMVRIKLRKLHESAEKQRRDIGVSDCLDANIARLAKLVGLSDTDCRILEFTAMLKNERLLDDATDWLGQLSSSKVFHVLSVVLNLPEPAVREALSTKNVLVQSGLVYVDRSCQSTLNGKLEVLSDSFADHMVCSDADPVSLLRDTVAPAAPPELGLVDYTHVNPSLAVLHAYLREALLSGRKGVNIFLYGAPGTGKSQLAKALANDLGCELFEVASEDEDGDPINGGARLRAFRAAQSFFGQRRIMMVFDEVEDVFNDGENRFGRKSTAQTRKAWINRTLETNRVPTVWVSNSVQCLDAAFIRRFDMVIELPVPPKRQRAKIVEGASSGLLDAPAVSRIAESEDLAPAIVTRAASVVESIRQELGAQGAASAMELLIGNTLLAQGHPPIRKSDPDRLPETYDPALIHADADLSEVAAGLVRHKAGRLCLYGPPGTGKTAYGRWLAEQMGVPLHVKRASDLMSKWLGDSEKNIADAFRQAEQEGAVLLIDEVDSFLQDRRGANQNWEVSQVNEMLTQMESFSGVFVASTNLMDGLDQAALRRFDLKVKFTYLKAGQAWDLFCRHCQALAFTPPSWDLQARLGRLQNLTPGDFAAVIRQHRFRAVPSPVDFVSALERECAVKGGAKSVFGFS